MTSAANQRCSRRTALPTELRGRPTILSGRAARGALAVLLGLALTACSSSSQQQSPSKTSGPSSVPATAGSGSTSAASVKYDGWEANLPFRLQAPTSCGKVGLQFPTLAVPTLVLQRQVFIKQVNKLGGTPIALDDKVDPTTQVANLRQLLAQNAKAIGLYPLDPTALTPVLQEAKSSKVPVVVENFVFGGTVPASAPPFTSQLVDSPDYTAFLQMQYVAEKFPKGKVGLITLNVKVPGLVYELQQQKYWAKRFGLQVVDTQDQSTDDQAGGQQAATAMLARHSDIQAFVSYNDPTATGAANAGKLTGKKVLAVGSGGSDEGLQAVKSGTIVTFMQNMALAAVSYADALCALSTGQKVPSMFRVQMLGPITQANVGTFKTLTQIANELVG